MLVDVSPVATAVARLSTRPRKGRCALMFTSARRFVPALACLAVVGGTVLVRDYRSWRRLGDGGVPANSLGYVIVTLLRIVKREPFSGRPYETMCGDAFDGSWLASLPPRRGTRPSIDPHPIPQRQVDQFGTDEIVAQTQKVFDAVVAASDNLAYAPSGFETRHDAVTLVGSALNHEVARRTRGEIAHIHPSDGSMHMVFSPSDATEVLRAGWGERHGLAGFGRLPLTYLMIYAPRDADELAVVQCLLDAAVSYMNQQK